LSEPSVCLVGQALVDVTLPISNSLTKMRLGGVAHAARALWALNATFSVGFIAPAYLEAQARNYLASIGAAGAVSIGTVDGSPNVMLIRHAEEAGPQGYELLLRDDHRVTLHDESLTELIRTTSPTDFLVFPDASYMEALAPHLPTGDARVYVDGDLDVGRLVESGVIRTVDTVMLSTSSKVFRVTYRGSIVDLRDALVPDRSEALLFKENRGGARFFTEADVITTPAHVRPVVHSVGVGDCFDAAFCVLRQRYDDRAALAYAAALAADYASTTDPDAFKAAAQATLSVPADEIVALSGVVVPWESRDAFSIYMAAPDFDYIDTRQLDRIGAALEYHGFVPRFPVREHGQLPPDATAADGLRVAQADLALLERCRLMVAVLLYDDPGTLIEIGIACERGLPVIVYDPHGKATNPMLTQTTVIVTKSLDETVSAVFENVGRLLRAGGQD